LTGTIAGIVNISNPTGTLTLTGLTVGGSLTITSLVTMPLTLVIDGVTCPAGSSFFALYRVWFAANSYVTIQNVNCPNFRIRNARIDAAATLEMANIVTSQAFQLTSNDIANQGTLDVRDSSVGGNMYVYANNFPSNSYLTVRVVSKAEDQANTLASYMRRRPINIATDLRGTRFIFSNYTGIDGNVRLSGQAVPFAVTDVNNSKLHLEVYGTVDNDMTFRNLRIGTLTLTSNRIADPYTITSLTVPAANDSNFTITNFNVASSGTSNHVN
jgi:hypothetical protein